MPEFLINGAVVLLAVIVGGWLLDFLRRRSVSGAAADAAAEEKGALTREIDVLRVETGRLEKEQATALANLENAQRQVVTLQEECKSTIAKYEALSSKHNQLSAEAGRAVEAVAARDRQLKEIREDNDRLTLEFKAIASEILKDHGATFKDQNKQQIDDLLKPLKEKIEKFEGEVTKSRDMSLEQHTALREHIKALSSQSAQVSVQAENLTKALKGKVQTQGAWGEMILETILQRSGLREGEEYSSQDSYTDEDGKRVRTDYIINLPNGEKIVLDAKVSLKDFEQYVNADDEAERTRHLAAHAASVKNHIKILAGKEYHSRAASKLDFVIMFMPIEAALGAALQHDGEIGFFAADNKVAIATPTTLTIALKTVAAIWRVERQNQNAAEIAARAGKLYDKFVGFVGDLQKVGDRLNQAQVSYNGAMGKLSAGKGNLVSQVQALKDMGAGANKSIPQELLDSDAPSLPVAGPKAGPAAGSDADDEATVSDDRNTPLLDHRMNN